MKIASEHLRCPTPLQENIVEADDEDTSFLLVDTMRTLLNVNLVEMSGSLSNSHFI